MPRGEGWDWRWAVRSIGLWILFGASVWAIGLVLYSDMYRLAIVEVCQQRGESCGEGWYEAIIHDYAVILGGVWGLPAGAIGSLLGSLSKSHLAYGAAMSILAMGPLAPSLWIGIEMWFLLTGLGAATWFASRLIAPRRPAKPPRTHA